MVDSAQDATRGDLWILGDNHGHFQHLIKAVKTYRPAAVISVGDIAGDRQHQPLEETLKEILELTSFWWIPGNHDTDSVGAYDRLFQSELANHNFDGKVVEIAGVRFAGLGGVFRGQVRMPPAEPNYQSAKEFTSKCGKGRCFRAGLPLRHRSTIFPDVYQTLAGKRADVLITHEAPSCHPHGFAVLDELARALGVQCAFHGHHHDNLDYSSNWPTLGFRAYGVGLRGITSLDGKVIVPGEHDAARQHRQKFVKRRT